LEAAIAWDWSFKGEKLVDTVKFKDFNIKLASMPYQNTKVYYAVADAGDKLSIAPKMFKRPMDAIRAVKKMLFGRKSEVTEDVDLGFGHLGNGITVWDRNREADRDYMKVAHIDAPYTKGRKITWYDKKLPSKAKGAINKAAKAYWKEHDSKNEVKEGAGDAGWKTLMQIMQDIDKNLIKNAEFDYSKIKTSNHITAYLMKKGLNKRLAGEITMAYIDYKSTNGDIAAHAKKLDKWMKKFSKKKNEIDLPPRAHMRPHYMS